LTNEDAPFYLDNNVESTETNSDSDIEILNNENLIPSDFQSRASRSRVSIKFD